MLGARPDGVAFTSANMRERAGWAGHCMTATTACLDAPAQAAPKGCAALTIVPANKDAMLALHKEMQRCLCSAPRRPPPELVAR